METTHFSVYIIIIEGHVIAAPSGSNFSIGLQMGNTNIYGPNVSQTEEHQ
jgi:hypothetical protein